MEGRPIIIGGEESGGLSIKGHVPEKDGILACLLTLEMVADQCKSLTEILNDIYEEVGVFLTRRLNFELTDKHKDALVKICAETPPQAIAGFKVTKVDSRDGYKFYLENRNWLMVRFSGTEPVVRCYVEADSRDMLETLSAAGKEFIFSCA